ncbi:hypothetical protein ACOJQI_11030 [Bacillus salacetis]|uniref:hypothetical protein n=1 Tax=Bacillus salacetis TaxID=2315464 RepID=UPI003BA26AD3
MGLNLTVNIPTYTNADSSFPQPVNNSYEYWIAVIEHFLTESDTIEIQCWNEEAETINEITSLLKGKYKWVKEDQITIFKLSNSLSLKNYLLKDCLSSNGELKWFTLNLEKMGLPVLHSGHWGTELVIYNISKEDIDFVKSVIPNEAILFEY